jgi:hypothetical protein
MYYINYIQHIRSFSRINIYIYIYIYIYTYIYGVDCFEIHATIPRGIFTYINDYMYNLYYI